MNIEISVHRGCMSYGEITSLKVVASAAICVALSAVSPNGLVYRLYRLIHGDDHIDRIGSHEPGDGVFLSLVILLVADQTVDVLKVLLLAERGVIRPFAQSHMAG
jgi:hypothetical protein